MRLWWMLAPLTLRAWIALVQARMRLCATSMSTEPPALRAPITMAVPPSVIMSMCSRQTLTQSVIMNSGDASASWRGITFVFVSQPLMRTFTRPARVALVVCRPGSRQISPPLAGSASKASSMESKSPWLVRPSPTL